MHEKLYMLLQTTEARSEYVIRTTDEQRVLQKTQTSHAKQKGLEYKEELTNPKRGAKNQLNLFEKMTNQT